MFRNEINDRICVHDQGHTSWNWKRSPHWKKACLKGRLRKKIDSLSLWQLIFDIIKANVSIKLPSWLPASWSEIYTGHKNERAVLFLQISYLPFYMNWIKIYKMAIICSSVSDSALLMCFMFIQIQKYHHWSAIQMVAKPKSCITKLKSMSWYTKGLFLEVLPRFTPHAPDKAMY